ncbi:MAG TPA: hypothetical protein VJZ76_10870 [Thermoanaerobaculia bacterium]|nr:hypothetical protein [Thermoanaerobaculia bacterium]
MPVGTESRAWLERAEISLASGDADSALDALQRADALFQPEHAMFFDAREQKSCVRASGSPAPVVRTRSSF